MTELSIRNRLWLMKNGRSYLGQGRVELMKAIIEHGSISAAARSMNMSYKKAWEAIDAMNTLSDKPLVKRTTGGSGGGGTEVTEAGKKAISVYENINQRCNDFLDEELKTVQS
ncbi:MAG: LysR family transcriptional regulator [Flavobacteriales bacterium]|nr:LysR family transcriptional regulator [Flavobacteriales bacterium]